jgi:Trypsin-co-occurring domain 1
VAEDRVLTIDLGDGMLVAVVAEESGPQLVANEQIEATLDKITGPVERVSREVLEAVKKATPTKATVELAFGLAVEQGQLLALFGKGKGEASLKVVLEWSARPAAD